MTVATNDKQKIREDEEKAGIPENSPVKSNGEDLPYPKSVFFIIANEVRNLFIY